MSNAEHDKPKASQQIHTGGGAYVGGNVNTRGGDFVGRDKVVHGDEVKGDKVLGDKVQGNKVDGVSIGNIEGGIHGSVISGRDTTNVNLGNESLEEQDDPVARNPSLQSLRAILSSLYETEADAQRIAQESGVDIRHVNFSTKPVNFWHSLLVEAHKQDRVKSIVSTASFEYSAKAGELRQAFQAYANLR